MSDPVESTEQPVETPATVEPTTAETSNKNTAVETITKPDSEPIIGDNKNTEVTAQKTEKEKTTVTVEKATIEEEGDYEEEEWYGEYDENGEWVEWAYWDDGEYAADSGYASTEIAEDMDLREWYYEKNNMVHILEAELWAKYSEGEISDEKLTEIQAQFDNCTKADSPYVIQETPGYQTEFTKIAPIDRHDPANYLDIVIFNETHERYAMRTLDKNAGDTKNRQKLYNAIREELTLNILGGDYYPVVMIYKVFEDKDNLYFITRYYTNGDLEEHLVSENRPREESEMYAMFNNVIDAVSRVHEINKSFNCLSFQRMIVAEPNGRQPKLLLSNFGVVKSMQRELRNAITSRLPQDYFFYAPEDFSTTLLTTTADVWALGVLLFIMKFGFPPFFSSSRNFHVYKYEMEELICGGFAAETREGHGQHFPSSRSISPELRDLITKMLEFRVKDRITLPEVKSHPFMLKHLEVDDLYSVLFEGILNYIRVPSYMKSMIELMVCTGMLVPKEEFELYNNQFQRLDPSGKGKIPMYVFQAYFADRYELDIEDNPNLEKLAQKTFDASYKNENGELIECVSIQLFVIANMITLARSHTYRLQTIFELWDLDANGTLEKDEFITGMKGLIESQDPATAFVTYTDAQLEKIGAAYEKGSDGSYTAFLATVLNVSKNLPSDQEELAKVQNDKILKLAKGNTKTNTN